MKGSVLVQGHVLQLAISRHQQSLPVVCDTLRNRDVVIRAYRRRLMKQAGLQWQRWSCAVTRSDGEIMHCLNFLDIRCFVVRHWLCACLYGDVSTRPCSSASSTRRSSILSQESSARRNGSRYGRCWLSSTDATRVGISVIYSCRVAAEIDGDLRQGEEFLIRKLYADEVTYRLVSAAQKTLGNKICLYMFMLSSLRMHTRRPIYQRGSNLVIVELFRSYQ